MRRLLPALLLVLPALPVTSAAEERKALLLYREGHEPATGTTMVEREKLRMKSDTMTLRLDGEEIAAGLESFDRDVAEATYLAPDKVRYRKTTGVTTSTMSLFGEAQPPETERAALEGVPVLLERVDGSWRARLEEGRPNKEQREELDDLVENFNADEDREMYGVEPRLIGESWKVDASLIPGFDEGELTGTIDLTLVGERVYRGMPCAVLEGEIKATLREEDDEESLTMTLKGRVDLLRSLEHYEDVKFSVSGMMTMKGEEPGGMGFSCSGPFEFGGTVEFGQQGDDEGGDPPSS